MKWILLLLIACITTNCNNDAKKQATGAKTEIGSASNPDTLGLASQIKNFGTTYEIIVKELYDSVSKYKSDDIDFSDITGGIERKYKECNIDTEKTLLGFKLAANYLIHYDSSKKVEYKQKAELLFYSFLSFKDGFVASRYMKLDIMKVQFIQKEWHNFSEADKETLMFYGLLRGFDNGLPDILKNVE